MAIKLSPGTLKIGLINLFKILPSKYAKFVLHKSSAATKKGNKLGSTFVAHKLRPSFAAIKFVSENNKRLTKNRIKRIVKKFFFKAHSPGFSWIIIFYKNY